MRYHDWNIIEVWPLSAEREYLFYPRSPFESHAITSWSGTATPFEQASIKHWVQRNAPGIPLLLAGCFAWRVTPIP
jgi:hypothetical protein